MTKIKTTHVGSLPRSNELSELLFKKDKKEKINLDNFDAVVKKDVKKIVKKQVDLGIDFISDGEMSKISYATYVKDRIDGFSGESERKAPKDLDDFPTFKERIARSGGTPSYTRPCCTNELKIKDTLSLTKDINEAAGRQGEETTAGAQETAAAGAQAGQGEGAQAAAQAEAGRTRGRWRVWTQACAGAEGCQGGWRRRESRRRGSGRAGGGQAAAKDRGEGIQGA